jgi:hypothetical protein
LVYNPNSYALSLENGMTRKTSVSCGGIMIFNGGPLDGGPLDEGPLDGGSLDGGPLDEGPLDEGSLDSGLDSWHAFIIGF